MVAVKFIWKFALCLAAGVCLCTAAQGDEIPIEHMRELLLTIEVRKTLFDDPELGPLNLGVKVNGRVATLWGPVPSMEIKRHAEQTLRKFPYISEVRNQLHVPLDELPMMSPAQIGKNSWLKNNSQHREPRTSGSLAAQTTPVLVQEEHRSVHLTLSPEVEVPRQRATDVDSPEAVRRMVLELQGGNNRYQGIGVRVLARDVFLTAEPGRSAQMYELAQTISRLPGVAQVVVRER